MLIGKGSTDRFLSEDEAKAIFREGLAQLDVDGKRVLIIIPDTTRSAPMPLCFAAFTENLMGRVAQLDFMIALGTHMPLSEERICEHLGITLKERHSRYANIGIYNHNWQEGLVELGVVPASEISALTDGLFAEDVPVRVNGRLLDYDQLIICGPVFPHEIAGFSGGNKYFFPGVAGPEVIDFTHWLGAVIGNVNTIGLPNTPTRKVIDRAAAFIDRPKACFSMVVKGHHDLAGLYFGTPEESQQAAAELSAQVNIKWVDRRYKLVISVMPELYDDIWTAGKGMYKLEPVVEDGGTVIIYAPHIDEISYTHGKVLDRIGYHVRDYFLARMDEMKGISRTVMAHSTHVKGAGTYENGVEKPRVNVILATG
ncbi:MAG: lactate racemase domain-containing protein, partial [Alphaproteobacteria bacterium]